MSLKLAPWKVRIFTDFYFKPSKCSFWKVLECYNPVLFNDKTPCFYPLKMLPRNQLTPCFPWCSYCTLRKHHSCTTRSRSWQGILILHLGLARHSLCQQARSRRGSEHRAGHSQPPRTGISLQHSPGPGRYLCPHSHPTGNGSKRKIGNTSATFSLEHGNHHSASQTFRLPVVNVCTGSEQSEPLMAFLSSAVHSHPLC